MFFLLEILFLGFIVLGILFFFLRKKSKYFLILSLFFFSLPVIYFYRVSTYEKEMQLKSIGLYHLEDSFLFLKDDLIYETDYNGLKGINGNWKFLADEDGDYIKLSSLNGKEHFLSIRDSLLILRSADLKRYTFFKQN